MEKLSENYELMWNGKVHPANYRIVDGQVVITVLGPPKGEKNPYFTIPDESWGGTWKAGPTTISFPKKDDE